DVLTRWGLWSSLTDHKLATITSDNASAIKSAGQLFPQAENSCTGTLPVLWSGCIAHSLQLAIHQALKTSVAIKELTKRCKQLALEFSNKHFLAQVLLHVQRVHFAEVMSNETPLSVILPVETRWNSTFDMMERLLILRPNFNRVLRHLSDHFDRNKERSLLPFMFVVYSPEPKHT
ncbi:hypothetical protein BGZ68_004118, partial [Mortierella alpina]